MEIVRFEIDLALRRALEPVVLDALFEYCVRHRVRAGLTSEAPVQITVTQAMEVLAAQQQRWNDRLGTALATLELNADAFPRRTMVPQMHDLLLRTHEFFRREGAETLRAAMAVPNDGQRFSLLWTDLFSRRVLDWLRENELVADPDHLEVADALVECAKVWTQELSRLAGPKAGGAVEPSSFLIDAETELSAHFERGPIRMKVRGKPDGLWLRPVQGGLHLHACKAGEPDLAALRVVQTVFYMLLVEKVRQQPCVHGAVAFLRAKVLPVVGGFSEEVETPFASFVGNASAVRRLKMGVALGLKSSPAKLADNFLLIAHAGYGKTELVGCVGAGLKLPVIELAARGIKKSADLLRELDQALLAVDLKPVTSGQEDGKQILDYPPFVLVFQEASEWRRMAPFLQPLLDVRDRRIFTETHVARFPSLTLMVEASSPAQIPEVFLAFYRRIELESYRPEEVGAMVRKVFDKAGLSLPESLALILARMGRCQPKRALDLAREFRDRHERAPTKTPLTREALLTLAHSEWKLDERGLSSNDYHYLQALESGPKGLPSLQQLLPFSTDELSGHVEPYLVHLGAVYRSSRGRVLTVLGEQLLHRRSQA